MRQSVGLDFWFLYLSLLLSSYGVLTGALLSFRLGRTCDRHELLLNRCNEKPSSGDSEDSVVHTLLLCRHGDSIWNGGEPGTRETFTGWTNVPLSQKGIEEAKNTGHQVAEFEFGIDACFTSILQRAQMTAHYCLWGFGEKPNVLSPRKYLQDYRLNERHYGALQGLVKEDVENGRYGHDPVLVKQWRRSWYTVPPLLEDEDPRRVDDIRLYANYCYGDPQLVPRGESLEQVAEGRIRPFLDEILCPVLEEASTHRMLGLMDSSGEDSGSTKVLVSEGGTGLVVAHANSLRALIGVICNVKEDAKALSKLEALRLQTGVPLVLRFRSFPRPDGRYNYEACDLDGVPFRQDLDMNRNAEDSTKTKKRSKNSSRGLVPELPVYPLSSIPLKPKPGTPAFQTLATTKKSFVEQAGRQTVPF